MTGGALRRLAEPGRWATLAAGLVSWLYLTLVVLLTVWLAMAMLATGWRPIVITGGSMQPALRVGDILLVEDHPDELLGQRSVITYEGGGEQLVTHRVHEVLPESQAYLTKGDANPSPDTDPVPIGEVVGVGRLVVPLLGLPAVWLAQGQIPTLIALGVISSMALWVAVTGFRETSRQRRPALDRSSDLADRGVIRLRTLAALVIATDLYLDRDAVSYDVWGQSRVQLVGVGLVVLLATNVIVGRLRRRSTGVPASAATAQLLVDTAVSVALISLQSSTGVAWAIITLPILEAAIRYRLAGALIHWTLMTITTVAGRLYVLSHSGAGLGATFDELEQLLEQLGVLLLIIVPGAYLTEQLLSDVLRQHEATAAAARRAQVLERVAETGYELNRLGTELFASLTQAVTSLGFRHADALLLGPDGHWRVLATANPGLPSPGGPASGLRPVDLTHAEVLIDDRDTEMSELLALQTHNLAQVARLTLSSEEGRHVVLRAATGVDDEIGDSGIDALRLLAGQAAVALQNRRLVSELQDVQSELAHQALHDALTGLPNRVQFLRHLDRALTAPDTNRRHVVMFLDLNGFKGVNDTLGHEVGDLLLERVADRLGNVVIEGGLVARIGGDEFTVYLEPVAGPEVAVEVARQIHEAIRSPFQLGDQTVTVGVSIGIAVGEVGLDGGELVRRGDVAMYAAKRADAATNIVVYEPSLDDEERRRTRLAADFRKALEGGELRLAYQPIVDAADRGIRGVEALLRWDHRELGAVDTGTILVLAETGNLADDLTAWIFATALREIAETRIDPTVDFMVAINVSPIEAASPRLVPVVEQSLVESGLPASWLVIELSERMVANGDAPSANITALIDLGCGLALDDFGQGQTSLAHLRDLPLQLLKLDLALVQQAAHSDTNRIILNSVVSLGHELHLGIVAEGVETEQQRQVAVAGGADLLQGFGIHRPMPLTDLRRLLAGQGLLATVLETTPEPTERRP
ncbi:MAG: signal peptidase I [Actinomycetota bacterium]